MDFLQSFMNPYGNDDVGAFRRMGYGAPPADSALGMMQDQRQWQNGLQSWGGLIRLMQAIGATGAGSVGGGMGGMTHTGGLAGHAFSPEEAGMLQSRLPLTSGFPSASEASARPQRAGQMSPAGGSGMSQFLMQLLRGNGQPSQPQQNYMLGYGRPFGGNGFDPTSFPVTPYANY